MPLYTYTCDAGHRRDAVRPIGVDLIPCPVCGARAVRGQVYHTHVVGPTVNTLRDGDVALAREAFDEREHIFRTAETDAEIPVQRPNDWAEPKRVAAEMLRHGEIDTAAVAREAEGSILRGVQL